MNNTLKVLCVFGALASFAACGDDDGDKPVDGGPGIVVTPIDGGTKDGGSGMDATVQQQTDAGGQQQMQTGDCFTGTPTKMADFLNRCTGTNVQTATKTIMLPAGLLDSNGKVLPL